jgi:MerR family mercuric resistance operon transcriptional regulator
MKVAMLPIREVASRSGVSVHTLRYYERAGLLPRINRSPSGYRVYGAEVVRRVRLVRMLRGLGFGIRELRSLAAVAADRFPRAAMRARLRVKRDEVGERLRDLERAWKLLDALQSCGCRGDCALVARLLDGNGPGSAGAPRPTRRKKRSGATRENRT